MGTMGKRPRLPSRELKIAVSLKCEPIFSPSGLRGRLTVGIGGFAAMIFSNSRIFELHSSGMY